LNVTSLRVDQYNSMSVYQRVCRSNHTIFTWNHTFKKCACYCYYCEGQSQPCGASGWV